MSAWGQQATMAELTKVFMRVDKPKGLGAIGTGLAEDADDDSKLKGEVDVKDSDLNRITLEFEIPNPLPSFVTAAWDGGSPLYLTENAVYESELYLGAAGAAYIGHRSCQA